MSKFNTSSYYRLTSDRYGDGYALSCSNATTPRDVAVTTLGRFGSENWQFLYQDGVYFIRNFLYNTTYHLGVSKYYFSAPIMLRATTELGQQWYVDAWGDGTYRISNRLINNGAANVTYVGIGEQWNTALMSSQETGSRWTITANPDRGPVAAAMLQPYSSIETPTGRPSPTGTGTSSASPTSSDKTGFFDPNHLSTLDKAGIAIGIATMIIIGVIFLFFRKRMTRYGRHGVRGVPGPPATPRQPRHGVAEVLPEPPPAYNARPTATFAFANNGSSTRGAAPDYYAQSGSRRKAADEESIELPPYGRPTTETRSFV